GRLGGGNEGLQGARRYGIGQKAAHRTVVEQDADGLVPRPRSREGGAITAGKRRVLVLGVGRGQRVHDTAACGLRRVTAVSSARMMKPVTMAKIICGWPRSISQP